MSKLKWDVIGERLYETGVSNVVLFPINTTSGTYENGVAWSGVTAVNENPSGAEPSPLYADNIKYLNLISREEMALTLEAYMYPDEFGACDGSIELSKGVYLRQQSRQMFGLAYKTLIGNDTTGTDYGYKINLVYGCVAAPSARDNNTVNENPDARTMSWDIQTTPIEIEDGKKSTAMITIDSTVVNDDTKMQKLLDMIYGTDTVGSVTGTSSKMPTVEDLIDIFGVIGG